MRWDTFFFGAGAILTALAVKYADKPRLWDGAIYLGVLLMAGSLAYAGACWVFPHRESRMIATILMIVFGVWFLASVALFLWPRGHKQSSEPLDNTVGIECAWSAPPSRYRDDKTLFLVDFQGVPNTKYATDFTKQTAGPSRFRRSAEPFKSSPHYGDYWYRCDIKNYGSQAIRNIRMKFPVEYRKPVKEANGSIRSGDVIARGFALSADFDLAANETDYFYFASASPAFVDVHLPSVATLQTLDSETVRTVKLILPTGESKRGFGLLPSSDPIGHLPKEE
jgi:hypothetical protein